MDAQKINEAVKACDLLAARTQDMGIIALARRLHGMTERQHKPTMALVSFNMNHAERFELLRSYAGIEVPAELGTKAAGEPLCLVLDYSPQPTLLADGGTDGVTVYGCPCEALRSHRIAICDEIREKDKWIALADEIDITCLLVNATMAMNQVERTWLQNCGQPLFWDNTPVIAMVGTQLLNSEEDAQAVAEAVNGALRRLQLNTKVFEQPQEALAWMDAFLNGDGDGKPKGLYHDAQTGITIPTADITADNVIDLVYKLKRPYRKKASFITNDGTLGALRKLKDLNGNYLWQPSLQASEPDTLLGYAIHTSQFAPVLAAGNVALAFGDYSYYNIGDRGRRAFQELKELFAGNGMVGFVMKERVDGLLILPEAVQLLKVAGTSAGGGSDDSGDDDGEG